MSLPYFLNQLDPYEPVTIKPRLQALDWYQINSLYRQSYTGYPNYDQLLVQKFSPHGAIDNSRNQQILAYPISIRLYRNEFTTLTTLN
jgi:hypothetical protein